VAIRRLNRIEGYGGRKRREASNDNASGFEERVVVTEGVVTISKVFKLAEAFLDGRDTAAEWASKKDGAPQIAQELFERATDINFFVGRAINPAHQNPDLSIAFGIKIQLIDALSKCLERMGKRIKVSYF